jgi:hypothetical protein
MTERMIPGLQFRTDSRQQQAIERESNKFSWGKVWLPLWPQHMFCQDTSQKL